MWDSFQEENSIALDVPLPPDATNDQASLHTISGVESKRSMRLMGYIQGREVSVLVDSRSSHTFISSAIAVHLQGASALCQAVKVQVANGDILSCSSQFLQVECTRMCFQV